MKSITIKFCSLISFIVLLVHGQEKFDLSGNAPQAVYDVALAKAAELPRLARTPLTAGYAFRFLEILNNLDVFGDNEIKIKQFLKTESDKRPPEWIVPVLDKDEVIATMVIQKRLNEPFQMVALNPHDDFGYALAEIAEKFDNKKGYHPLIIQVSGKINMYFLCIPELPYDNFTHISYFQNAYFGENSAVRKTRLMHFYIDNNAMNATPVMMKELNKKWKEENQKIQETPALKKKAVENSEFGKLPSFEETKAWIKTLKLSGT